MKSISLTIGIPAYNEEANLSRLLEDILKQDRAAFSLKRILVVSDGSTDETVNIAKRYESYGVTVFDDGLRKGKAARVNEIFIAACPDSDAVILFDADISLEGPGVLDGLVSALRDGADLVSPSLLAVPARTFFGRAIVASHELKCQIFSQWKKGKNVYSCHGAARAFSKRLFSVLRFGESVGEDAYSYFFSRSKGFNYVFLPSVSVSIRVPESFADHKKQSLRYSASQKMFVDDFGREVVFREYNYPKGLLLRNLLLAFARHPLFLLVYVVTMMRLLFSFGSSQRASLWETATSSKSIE